MSIRVRLTPEEAEYLGIEIKSKIGNCNPKYSVSKDKLSKLDLFRTTNPRTLVKDGIKENADDMGLSVKDVPYGWIKTDTGSFHFKNPNFSPSNFDIKNFDFENAFKNVKPIKVDKTKSTKEYDAEFDRLVLSDVHIGMDASDKGNSLYNLSWNTDDIWKTLTEIIRFTINNQKSKHLIIVELGDYLDGFNGQTTRGGHHLVQNLSNQDAFDLGLKFKITLLESLLPYFDTIQIHNINNDNHSGDFSYCLNSALKVYVEKAYSQVLVINQTKFLDYTINGNYCFVTTHGKDITHMKFGFKPKLDPAQINKIVGYLSATDLLNKGYQIIFEKGDSHQYLFDNSSSDLFKYYNYPALSPSSNWVQTNFQKGQRGFVLFNYYKNRKTINEYFF